MKSMPEQRGSGLLSREENEQVFRLLGPRCQTLATTVVQLFVTLGPDPDQCEWTKKDVGVLCLVKDNARRSYFFRLLCPQRYQLLWEHEIYNNMDYLAPRSFLHTFEAEDCIAGFNFASEAEAAWFRNVVLDKLEAKKQRRMERRSRSSVAMPSQSNAMLPNGTGRGHRSTSSGERKQKEKDVRRRLTKADIGTPQDFRHIAHVGWDPNKGFDVDNVDDPQLNEFFLKAGVSESQLRDRETREFIYDFINRHGGLDAVKEEIHPPPVPARASTSRIAPPPPPHRTGPLPAPPPPPPPPLPPVNRRYGGSTTEAQAPPPVHAAPSAVSAPPPPPPPPAPALPPAQEDPRSALLDAIRSGKPLKHVDPESKKQADSRGELLTQIRQGVELKAVSAVSRPAEGAIAAEDSLAGALARALAERSRVIHSDTSSSSDEDDEEDDEWED